MNARFNLKTGLVAAAALLAMGTAQAANMTRSDFSASKTRISDTYKSDKAACDAMSGNAKDICVEEAKGKEKVARAQLDYDYSGKPKDATKIAEAKAKAAYAVAKEKCDDKTGNDNDVCVQQAKANQTKAMADAKMNKEVAEARKDATEDKRDADYKVAAEKCDAMAGDAKSACMNAAKARFGKS